MQPNEVAGDTRGCILLFYVIVQHVGVCIKQVVFATCKHIAENLLE